MLDSLHHTSPRTAEAAARGRAAFLAEAAAMRDEFVHKPARGVWGRLSELIKRCLGIGRSGDESLGSSLHMLLRRVSASLVPGLIATFASVTIVVVAQNSLPNQPLYPMKLWSEDVQLSLTAEPDSRLALLIKFINCRVSELDALYQKGESPSTGLMLRLEAQVSEALQLLNAQSGSDAYDAATVHALERLRATATAPLLFVVSPDRVFHTSVPLPTTPTATPTGTPVEKVASPIILGTASVAPVPLITFTTVEENTAVQTNEKATRDTIQAVGDSVDIKASLPTAVAVTVPAPSIGITPQPVQVIPTLQPTMPQPTVMPQPTPTPVYIAPTVQPTVQPTVMPQPTPTPLALVPIPVVPTTVKPAPPLLPIEPIAPPALPIDTPAAPALPILPTVMNPVPAPIFSLENPEATATPLPDESMRTTAPPTLGPMPDQTQQQGEPSGNE